MNEFAIRREKLLATFDSDSVIILVGNTEKVRSKNFNYLFRQNSDFFYITGFEEPDAVAVLRPDHDQGYTLFCRSKDSLAEIYFGERAGPEGAVQQYYADSAYPIEDIHKVLPSLLEDRGKVYLSDVLNRFGHSIFEWLNLQQRTAKFDEIKVSRSLHDIGPYLHEQRKIKDDAVEALIL